MSDLSNGMNYELIIPLKAGNRIALTITLPALSVVFFPLPTVLTVIPIMDVNNALLGVITLIQHINDINLYSYQLFCTFPADIL